VDLLELDAAVPVNLPARRETHWDTLLHEMKWLATDFIQERKWKAAACRTLGEAFVTRNARPKKAAAVEEAVHVQKEELLPAIARGNKEDNAKQGDENIIYADVTDQDLMESRRCAKVLSAMVHEVTRVIREHGALSYTPAAHVEAFQRFQQTKEAIFQQGKHNTGDEDMTDADSVDAGKAEVSSNPTDGAEDTMGEFVDPAIAPTILDTETRESIIATISARFNEISPLLRASTEDTEKKGMDVDGVSLSNEQAHIVRLIEYKWKTCKLGTELHGTKACGKTVLACAVLARNASTGPQLLVCRSTSMVSSTLVHKSADANAN